MMAAPQGPGAKSTGSRSPKRIRKLPGRAMAFVLEMELGGGGEEQWRRERIHPVEEWANQRPSALGRESDGWTHGKGSMPGRVTAARGEKDPESGENRRKYRGNNAGTMCGARKQAAGREDGTA